MINVLVLCTANSCRSQMAHGWLEYYSGGTSNIYSAGIEIQGVNPKAIYSMAKAGVDISHHTSNHVDEYLAIKFDYIITVCDHAADNCPAIPSKMAVRVHQSFFDPTKLKGTDEIDAAFDRTNKAINAFCKKFVKENLSQ